MVCAGARIRAALLRRPLPPCFAWSPSPAARRRKRSPLLEIAPVRWRVVLADRHQQAVRAQHVILLADDDMLVVGRTVIRTPGVVAKAAIASCDRPGTRQRIVDGGDLVAHHVGIVLVQADTL